MASALEIDAAALKALRDQGAPHAVLDVREPWELAIARLPDTIDLPLGVLTERADALPRDAPLVVMCHHGARSLRATLWLRANGFPNAVNLAGGIDAWSAQIDPAVSRY